MSISLREPFTEDRALAQQVIDGNQSALTMLYERYADSLFAFIYHRLDAPRADVEEIWQETWLAALRSIGSYRGHSQLFTWLCSLARHKIADYCRKRGHQSQVFTDNSPEIVEVVQGNDPLPEEILTRRDVRSRVAQTLMALPDEYRLALIARYADGYSVDQVARLLDKSYKAAESLLSRAKAAFRTAFGEEQ
jgi:RNA polymerase sigma-70 factor (ECF subfamily)